MFINLETQSSSFLMNKLCSGNNYISLGIGFIDDETAVLFAMYIC